MPVLVTVHSALCWSSPKRHGLGVVTNSPILIERTIFPTAAPFSIGISISYNKNAFVNLFLSITGCPAFNSYEVC